MTIWNTREELSKKNRLRRSYYKLLRDELDEYLVQYSLIDSYNNFCTRKIPYPFVEKRELKPRWGLKLWGIIWILYILWLVISKR